jgi:hypothetical protein
MCTICAKRTIDSKIILDTLDGTPRFEAQLEACFGPFGDSANLDADSCTVYAKRTIGSEIIFDIIDGTPRRRGSLGISFRSIWRWC